MSQPGPDDAAARARRSASTGSCGGATTRTTRARTRSRASTCASCFHDTDPAELQQILAGNAAELYDFDLDALAPLAAKVGPTVAELAAPLTELPGRPERSAAQGHPPLVGRRAGRHATGGESIAVHERASRARRRRPHHGDADLAARPRRPGVRDRIEPLRYSSGNELRQTGDPDEQLARPRGRVRPAAAKHASDEYRADEAEPRSCAQELRRDRRRSSPRTGPARSTCSGSRASSSSTRSTTAGCTTGSTAATSSSRYGAARAHNRGMVEFCSVDPRLLPTCYVPLVDFDARRGDGRRGDRAWARPRCSSRRAARPATRPATSALDPVWARAQEAGIPVVFHVGGTGDLIDPTTSSTACPIPPDFHGGEENFRSVDYMGIPGPPAQTLATMIFDGVLERFPELRIGVIEQGAIWVPSWMRQMESAFEAFARHEERLRALSLRPSEYVRRQVRFTPYPTEDVGWIIEQAGPEVVPVLVGLPPRRGRPPAGRAVRGVARRRRRATSATRFYRDNFLDLMGTAGVALAR